MTNSTNQILVQDIETFTTITRLTVGVEVGETVSDRIDQYLTGNERWGIVSLEDDADGEYMAVLLVAPVDGPDFIMDMDTGEMEPAEELSSAQELDAKMDIMMEMDMNDVAQEDILLMLQADEPLAPVPAPVEDILEADEPVTIAPVAFTPPKTITTNTQSNTQSKGNKTMKNHEILASFITANPGVTRAIIFADAGLQGSLRSPAQVTAIAAGDKQETKRWNSCINRFVRKIRRDGTDIQVNGQGKTATFSIGAPDGQLRLPFTQADESANAAIIGDGSITIPAGATNIEVVGPDENIIKYDTRRDDEAANQSLDFESLLATLDDDEATITSDDQVAFKAAQKMIK